MSYVGQKKHLISWFIEAQNGKYFNDFIIKAFEKYKRNYISYHDGHNEDIQDEVVQAMNQRFKRELREKYLWMYPVITFLSKKDKYYLHRAQIKKQKTKGRKKKNYEWIERILLTDLSSNDGKQCRIYYNFKSMFDITYSKRQQDAFKKTLKKNLVCDNRDCSKRGSLEKQIRKSKRRRSDGFPTEIIIEQRVVGVVHTGKWYRCARCRMVYYCSRHCQKVDWNKYHHKRLCFEYPLHGKQKRMRKTVEGK